jgi:MtaA/CmuA family methyltransferase
MTGRKRYLNTIEGKPVDFLPRIPILMRYAAEYIGSNYGAFTRDHRILVEANQRCAQDFGIDQMNTMSDPYRETQGYGAICHYDPESGVHIEAPPLANDGGELNLSQLRPPLDPMQAERMRDRIEAVRRYCAENGKTHSVMGWVEGPGAEAGDVRGVENFFIDLLTDANNAGQLMDTCVEIAITFAKIQIDLGADTIGIGDAVASQVSWPVYSEHILPREIRLVAALKAMGAKVRLHICGNITHILPGIAQLGIDVLDVDHMVDLREVRRIVGPRVTLGGNLDPVHDVLEGTPEKIRAALRRAYAEVGNPFMVNAGCEIPSGTPVENLKALCEPIEWKP